ncbi:23S rRNA (uracil(1939)-C(5))-methyltransferase RlmD [Anaeropeptidivorans aminofermentans]|uniref:23S rRNA (uracil(1939)-C(5))-methyltransferase RlmD n=1 Tax=Anaeropeptidivorans aminofermentans TaxID=2934315 RepID=UPI002024EB38|nr:23S rRNA (uracil(1939)-C(5))-methyltransferase RlmD [Anaeropeptidivorans aminofermentans]
MAKKFIKEIEITDFEFPNMGIGVIEEGEVKVKNALPGQVVEALIGRKKRSLYGSLMNVSSPSKDEITPLCSESGICGGCTFQSLPYNKESDIKKNALLKLFAEGGISLPIDREFVFAEEESHYRNKMEYSFGDNEKGGNLELGMRKRNSYYEVSNGSQCKIAPEDYGIIVKCVKGYFSDKNINFYHRMRKDGHLRHLIIRKGFFTGEILINLVTAPNFPEDLSALKDMLLSLELSGEIKGILHTENDSVADIIRPDNVKLIYGRDYFYEKINGLIFKISPFSFFQTNSQGAERLYETVREFAGEDNSVIFDLYCGTGTIGQILSFKAKEVMGIELIEEAVAAANENTKLNGISNCRFIAGDVLKKINELDKKPSLIVLDPPREGIHPKAIGPIIDFSSPKIIYVSCNPVTLVRDLKIFTEAGYEIEKVRFHDMFPRSYHMECVVELCRISNNV